VKVTVDTSVLVRAVMRDGDAQSRAAERVLREATVVAVALPSLCEFVWVLRRVYALEVADIAAAVEALLATPHLAVDRPAAEAGLAMLQSGGDFADGVIAHEGRWLGGETFVSFDRRAVALLHGQGVPGTLL